MEQIVKNSPHKKILSDERWTADFSRFFTEYSLNLLRVLPKLCAYQQTKIKIDEKTDKKKWKSVLSNFCNNGNIRVILEYTGGVCWLCVFGNEFSLKFVWICELGI